MDLQMGFQCKCPYALAAGVICNVSLYNIFRVSSQFAQRLLLQIN